MTDQINNDEQLSEEQAKKTGDNLQKLRNAGKQLNDHDQQQSELFKAWEEGKKILAQPGAHQPEAEPAQELEEDEKQRVIADEYRDRQKAEDDKIPFGEQKAGEQDQQKLVKPKLQTNQFGLEGIQERWKAFEQQQTKSLQGINQLEQSVESAQEKLTKFDEKHGDYLGKSIKQATGGDTTKMKAYEKLKAEREKLHEELGSGEKSLKRSRDQYQKDHHDFHGDSWKRVAEQAKADGFQPFAEKAQLKSQEHQAQAKDLKQHLPQDQNQVYTRSVTEQKVADEKERSNQVREQAETDPELKKEIASGLELAQTINQATERRTASRADELEQRHKIKQKV